MPKTVVRFSHSEQAIEEAFARWKANDPIAVLVGLMRPGTNELACILEAAGYLETSDACAAECLRPWKRFLALMHKASQRFPPASGH